MGNLKVTMTDVNGVTHSFGDVDAGANLMEVQGARRCRDFR